MKKLLIATAPVLCAGAVSGCADCTEKTTEFTNEENRIEEESAVMEDTSRTVIDFGSGWKFLKLTQKDGLSELTVEDPAFDDSSWEAVELPHTWNAQDGADGRSGTDEGGEHYYRGLGGYRKTFTLPQSTDGKRIFIEFEGANTVTEVYLNGSFVGKHEGGYSAFRFDITDFVKSGEENVIAVKVSNAPTRYIAPIDSQGDFTKMGGIYRDVSIIAVEQTHIDLMDYGSSGVYVTPKNISDTSADIDVLVKIANDGAEDKNLSVNVDILDADGKTAASGSADVSVSANENGQASLTTALENPVLWNGVENPYLYTAKVTLSDGEELDSLSQTFGIRTYYIDPDEGFFLNGEYLDLHGVNYHQDSYENGWAMTNEERERDYNMMIDLGCTTVRMAHYQHDGYEYDLCDRLGITVWTEIGIVNTMAYDNDNLVFADGFKENAKQQLLELVRQNYNHPSVIVWGITNELYQMSDEIFDFYTELVDLAKTEDSTRLVTHADNQVWGRFTELPTDAVGYNKYYGWYIDGADDAFGKWLDGRHAAEKRGFSVSEYGGGGAISQHKDNIVWGTDIDSWGARHPENYQSALHEDIWRQFSERPYIWGKYVWCMFDFASDGRQEGDTKGQNDKGLCTREREPKDAYYFYKSVWNSEPMLHLTEQRFTERPNLVPVVKAYSNADSVELFVDGVSMGAGQKNKTVFTWENVQIKEDSASEIKVAATLSDGTTLEDTAEWTGYYVEPEVKQVNAALNKPVVYVSSEEAGNTADKINDGTASDSSRWCAASADSYPAQVIIDLEDTHKLTKIYTVTHKPGSRAYGFTVSISDTRDGEYKVIVDHSGNTDTSGYFTDVLSEPAEGRYLKIEVTGCSDENAFPCIWEIEAYEDAE